MLTSSGQKYVKGGICLASHNFSFSLFPDLWATVLCKKYLEGELFPSKSGYHSKRWPLSVASLEECPTVPFNLVQSNFLCFSLTILLSSDCVNTTIYFKEKRCYLFSWLVKAGKSHQLSFIKRGFNKKFY